MNVVILATCRKPELIKATTMVFDTIRVGFPTAGIHVYGNDCDNVTRRIVADYVAKVGGTFVNIPATQHDIWIEQLCERLSAPFVLCDTDMVFFEKVEDWTFQLPVAGATNEGHYSPTTKCYIEPRLDTSLMFIRPQEVRDAVRQFHAARPKLPWNISLPLWRMRWNHGEKAITFYDTGCDLYHTIGGQHFAPWQRDAYGHVGCGTWLDAAMPAYPEFYAKQLERINNPQLLRGFWREQDAWKKLQHP